MSDNMRGATVFPKDDSAFEEVSIKSVRQEKVGAWSIERDDGFSFFVPADSPVKPKAGMVARFYGKGIGFPVRGLYLDRVCVFYRTEQEEQDAHRADTYCLTAKDLIARWDGGKTIWSVELGGFGPGYEQALQIAAIEFAREGLDVPVEGDRDEFYRKGWDEVCNHALTKNGSALNNSIGGMSGAMFGAAKWLSWQWVHGGGPAALVDRVKQKGESQLIQVSRSFPQAPSPA